MDFSVDGDIKYLSHHDMLRMFGRALARALLPIRYSQGFNPHPRMSLPLPRPTGVASDAERFVVELVGDVAPDDLVRRLQDQRPEGIRIRSARLLEPGDRCRPNQVAYQVFLPVVDRAPLRQAVEKLFRTDSVLVERETSEPSSLKCVDIRPFIDRIDVTDDGFTVVLRVTERGTARPTEVGIALGLQDDVVRDRIRRTEVQWQ